MINSAQAEILNALFSYGLYLDYASDHNSSLSNYYVPHLSRPPAFCNSERTHQPPLYTSGHRAQELGGCLYDTPSTPHLLSIVLYHGLENHSDGKDI